MYKKVISVGMSFLMLFELSTVNVFAKGGDGDFNSVESRNTEKERHNSYCESSPKNECGKPEDVGCVIEDALADFATKIDVTLPLDRLGEKCETDVYLWKYAGLKNLAGNFEDWLKNANKRSIKGQFVANFIQETNKLFNLNSEVDAVGIVNNWLKKSNYSKSLYVTKEDLLKWADKTQKYEKDVSADIGETLRDGGIGAAIGGAGGAGIGGLGGVLAGAGAAAGGGTAAGIGTAAVAAEAAPLLAGAVGAGAAGGGAAAGAGVAAGAAAGAGAIALAPLVAFAALTGAVILGVGGAYYGYHSSKERKLNKKALEELKKSAKQERKWDVYSRALENIFKAIGNEEWVNNDLLLAKLNYGKDSPYAMTNFINVGAEVPKNVNDIFANLTTTLSNLTKKFRQSNYKNNKEEL